MTPRSEYIATLEELIADVTRDYPENAAIALLKQAWEALKYRKGEHPQDE